jgi:MFS family permease
MPQPQALAPGRKRPAGTLRQYPALARFWTGSTISMFGSTFTTVAVPVIAVHDLRADAFRMGLLAATGTAVGTALRLPAAAWADLTRARATVIISRGQFLGGLLIALVPVLWFLGLLDFAALVIAAAGATAAAVLVEGFAGPLLPRLVPREDLAAANGRFMISRSCAEVSGPGVAGLLLQAVSAPVLMIIDAASYVAAGLLSRTIREPLRPPPAGVPAPQTADRSRDSTVAPGATRRGRSREQAHRLVGGFGAVFQDRFLRRCLAVISVMSLANGIAQALLVILLLKTVGVSASLVGFVLAVGAVGGVVGGLAVGWLRARFGLGRTAVLAALLLVASLSGLPFAGVGWTGIAACVGYELTGSLGATLILIVVFSEIPARVRGDAIARGLAVANLVPEACATLGALAGGLLGTAIGVRPALLVGLVAAVLGAAAVAAAALPSALVGTREKTRS